LVEQHHHEPELLRLFIDHRDRGAPEDAGGAVRRSLGGQLMAVSSHRGCGPGTTSTPAVASPMIDGDATERGTNGRRNIA
jgi:hypothetical protein